MTRRASRASTAQLNRIHRLVAKAVERELAESLKGDGRVPAALLGKAVDFLKMTGVTEPEKSRAEKKQKNDELLRAMPDFDAVERAPTYPREIAAKL